MNQSLSLQHRLEYAGVRLLIAGARCCTPALRFRLGAWLGGLAYLFRLRRAVALDNFSRAFDTPPHTTALAVRASYRGLGQTALEHAAVLASQTPDIRSRITVTGETHLAQALQRGQGVVLVTGHFGYWELLGASVAALGYPIAVVAKDQHNPAVNALINTCREHLGMRVIPMASATHPVARTLRRNGCVGMLADQDAGPGGVFVRFLGRSASTYQGPAVFALRTGAALIPCFIVRDGVERHRVVFESPIETTKTGDETDEIHRCTQAYTAVLEQYVRAYPDHWFWVHRRWKTQPT